MKAKKEDCFLCAIKNKSILKNCNNHELGDINETKSCHIYQKGQIIFNEGMNANGVFCINNGKVKLVKTDKNAKEYVVRLAADGDILGIKALLSQSEYSATAIAMDDCKVCFLPKDNFSKMINNNHMVTHDILLQLAGALNSAESKMAHLAMKPVRERLAESLLLLKEKFENQPNKDFEIKISREDLASIVGTAKETVTRFLSDFKEEKLIDTKGSNIIILDENKLKEISELYD